MSWNTLLRTTVPSDGPERVDAAHVAEHAPAEVVDVVEGDRVALGQALGVAPAPADGDAGVVQVGDFVVGDRVVAAVADPDADGAREDAAAVADDVVVDRDVAGPLGFVRRDAGFADPHAAGAEVVEVAAAERAVAAALAEPDDVGADVADLAVLERHVPRAVGHDHRFDRRGGLGRLEPAGRREPLAVLEGQALERDVLDELARRRIALDDQELLRHRRDDLGLGHVLAGQRLVVQRAVAGQEPLARRVERRAGSSPGWKCELRRHGFQGFMPSPLVTSVACSGSTLSMNRRVLSQL